MLTKLVRKVHIYAGLLTLSQLGIYGSAGLVATVQPSLERPKNVQSVRYLPFRAPASSNDKEVARQVYEQLQLPLTRPMPDWFLRRTPAGDLLLDFYQINGIYRVVVLEKEGRVRVEEIRNSLALFVEDIHAATLNDEGAPAAMRIWAAWNELGMWTLLLFCVSGVWLWLATRARFRPAWIALIAGAAAFGTLWVILR
ncbi:MAG TPA: hypothetical protein VEQ63_04525 [Bryobacteraceae bacterium]|nr:hypothetical protein [Bryobacteraceae bacterium]